MRRVVLVSADLTGDAMDELKQWLAISRDAEDDNLITLLQASLDMCEGFLGQRPLEAECEELIELNACRSALKSQPVRSILSAAFVAADGSRTALAEDSFLTRIDADGTAEVELVGEAEQSILAVRFTAGIASTWAELPGALRQGIIRLAAFHYRERDSAKTMPPPASVTALWRPWQQMRLV
jgi:uncharacterized phiE125 gp8 family phage protein